MLLNGFTSLLSLEMILLMFGGVIVGIIFGAIPGLSATMAIVLFLPITFNMGTTQAFALLVALYIGGGKIVHASNSKPYPQGGIKVSNIGNPRKYSRKHAFLGIRRVR